MRDAKDVFKPRADDGLGSGARKGHANCNSEGGPGPRRWRCCWGRCSLGGKGAPGLAWGGLSARLQRERVSSCPESRRLTPRSRAQGGCTSHCCPRAWAPRAPSLEEEHTRGCKGARGSPIRSQVTQPTDIVLTLYSAVTRFPRVLWLRVTDGSHGVPGLEASCYGEPGAHLQGPPTPGFGPLTSRKSCSKCRSCRHCSSFC